MSESDGFPGQSFRGTHMTDTDRIQEIEDRITATAPVVDTAPPAPPAAPVVEDDDGEEDTEATAAPDRDDAPAPRQKKDVGKRINELTREKYEALREAEELRRENEALRNPQSRQPQQAKPAQADTPDKPTLEAFDFDQEAYSEALADWKVEQKFAEREKAAEQQKAQKTAQEQLRKFKEREAAFSVEHPDYMDVAYTRRSTTARRCSGPSRNRMKHPRSRTTSRPIWMKPPTSRNCRPLLPSRLLAASKRN